MFFWQLLLQLLLISSSVSTIGASMIAIIADLQRSVCGFVGSCEKEKQ